MGGQRYQRDARGDCLAVSRDHPPGARLREAGQQGVAAHRCHGVHPGIRRRALVGTGAAQPERAAAQGEAALRAECDGDIGSVAAEFVRATQDAAAACGSGGRTQGLPGWREQVDEFDEPPWPAELTLTTGPPANGGSCVARYEGRVVFVRYALPGETVRSPAVGTHG